MHDNGQKYTKKNPKNNPQTNKPNLVKKKKNSHTNQNLSPGPD